MLMKQRKTAVKNPPKQLVRVSRLLGLVHGQMEFLIAMKETGHPECDDKWFASARGQLVGLLGTLKVQSQGIHRHIGKSVDKPEQVETELGVLALKLLKSWIPTVVPGPHDEATAQRVGVYRQEVEGAVDLFSSIVPSAPDDHRLGPTDLCILNFLNQGPEPPPQTSEIAKAIGANPSSIGKNLSRLKKMKLVSNPGRQGYTITAQGQAALDWRVNN